MASQAPNQLCSAERLLSPGVTSSLRHIHIPYQPQNCPKDHTAEPNGP